MRTPLRLCLFLLPPALTLLLTHPVCAQSSVSRKNVQLTFLPPPLENASYSLGIYEAKNGKLVRRLHEAATENAFTAGLNGLITKWDGKDDDGKPVPPGHYAARGYGVGPLKVEGVEFIGNDWIDEDESLRVKHVEAIALVPEDDGLAVVATMADGVNVLFRLAGKDGAVLWKQKLTIQNKPPPTFVAPGTANKIDGTVPSMKVQPSRVFELFPDNVSLTVVGRSQEEAFHLSDGSKDEQTTQAHRLYKREINEPGLPHDILSDGKDGTEWLIAGDGLYQALKSSHSTELVSSPDKIAALALRGLERKENEPRFVAVTASASHDRLYLLEEMPGWQRVRGLSWVEAKEEDGKKVSDWETFFERNIRQSDPVRGLADPAVAKLPPASPVKIDLVENPLTPGKSSLVEMAASFDENGSYLVTTDGLRLRKISKQPDLRAVKLVKGDTAKSLTLFQNDGAAWEEFSIKGANEMMSFDAGEFEMTANGEKPIDTKAAEPPDL